METAAVTAERFHLDFVDGMRAIAALFVTLSHAWFQPANGYYASRFMNRLGLSCGALAVAVFIVLSGFCLMLPIARQHDVFSSYKVFLRRRAHRILPPYYITLTLSILFILLFAPHKTGTVWDNSLPLTWQQGLSNLLLLQNLPLHLPGGRINYPLWSIAVECQLYLLMPLLVTSLRSLGNVLTLTWTIALGIALTMAYPVVFSETRIWYLGLFTLGAVAARLSLRRELTDTRWLWPTVYVSWLLLAAAIALRGREVAHVTVLDTGVGIATMLTLLAMVQDNRQRRQWLSRLLCWRPLVTVGVFSYSLYLLHAPLLHALDQTYTFFLHPRTELRFLLLVCSLPLILATAYRFHLHCERPFMNTRPR